MKKVFALFFFLSACMASPQKAFQLDFGDKVYSIPAVEIETVSMTKHFDVLPHIEDQMPTSPEEAVSEWVEKHLKASKTGTQKVWIVVYHAEMLQTDLPNESLFKLDEVNYTLNYKLEIQVRENNQVVKRIPVEGKGFVVIAKKASLSKKEKNWAELIQKMLAHLEEKIKQNVIAS